MNLEQVCKKAYQKRYDEILGAIAEGTGSFDQYQRLVGRLHGMSELMEMLTPYLRDPDDIDDLGR